MLALLALIWFVIALVKIGALDTWTFWMVLGLVFLAADLVFTGLGYTYPWRRRR